MDLKTYANFMRKVRVTNDLSGCWHWLASTHTEHSHGVFHVTRKKTVSAPRLMFEHASGLSCVGRQVKHVCGNALCVNPSHLVLGGIPKPRPKKERKHASPKAPREPRPKRPPSVRSLHRPLYAIWKGMRARCYQPNNREYHRYGARGIAICDRWLHNFAAFFEDMGDRPAGMQIDRIDNDQGYSPSNCRWATPKQNSRNQRRTVFVEYLGERITIAELAERHSINYYTLYRRIEDGWPIDRAVSQPVKRAA